MLILNWSGTPVGILRNVNSGAVNPPQKMTVIMVIREVVVKNICLASDMVFCMANANAMAPLNPENQSMCW